MCATQTVLAVDFSGLFYFCLIRHHECDNNIRIWGHHFVALPFDGFRFACKKEFMVITITNGVPLFVSNVDFLVTCKEDNTK